MKPMTREEEHEKQAFGVGGPLGFVLPRHKIIPLTAEQVCLQSTPHLFFLLLLQFVITIVIISTPTKSSFCKVPNILLPASWRQFWPLGRVHCQPSTPLELQLHIASSFALVCPSFSKSGISQRRRCLCSLFLSSWNPSLRSHFLSGCPF